MSFTLYYHPLSSFCQKVLVGLYELDVPFEKHLVDLMNEAERAALVKLWPLGKFPVLTDGDERRTIAESSIILEYVDRQRRLVPSDADAARECRMRDRFFDLYVNMPVGKIVTDRLRPEGRRDALGVEQAWAQLETAFATADEWMRAGPWAAGATFTMADCAAAPALLYAHKLFPFGGRRHLAGYYARLEARPSFARVLEEARPYLATWPPR